MGIPYYFSFLIKNNKNLLLLLENLNKNIHNFYLDCNSIIYDCIKNNPYINDTSKEEYEWFIIKEVCNKIDEYIFNICPTKNIFISFDGVAPIAKLNQQRNRRYLSHFEKKILNQKQSWNQTAITPGTEFMHKLSEYVINYYKNNENKYNVQSIIISTSNEPGEGEHKLFNYIRKNKDEHKNQTTIIYGIDADLIMLCLNHIHLCKNIYLYRETPFFIQSLDKSIEPNKCYILNIHELAKDILLNMKTYSKYRIQDYIFICFLLGNDFLPHFPSINIRNNGFYKLLNCYNSVFKNTSLSLTYGNKICWNNLRKFIKVLTDYEERNLRNEYIQRDKLEKRQRITNDTSIEDKYLTLPIHQREVEKYINPFKEKWRERYYTSLFDFEPHPFYLNNVCTNYLEGLEWTFKYYNDDCYDWNWCYNYHYPPLLTDLIQYIPHFDTIMIEKKPISPVHPYIQLSYVIPQEYNDLLPQHIREKLLSIKDNIYPDKLDISWAFCNYFWQCHLKLPNININQLKTILNIS